MIEIFGSPYPGTIGSGKLYPAGYQGPDFALYAYVKVNSVNDSTVPRPSQAFLDNYKDQTSGSSARFVHGWGLSLGIPSSWKNNFNLTLLNGTASSVNYTDFTSNTIPTSTMLQNLNLPVMATGYSYVAPTEWGNRASVGELQKTINDMVQAQADLNHELYAWESTQAALINKLRFLNAKYEWDADVRLLELSKEIFDVGLDVVKTTLETASKISDASADFSADAANSGKDFIPTMLPEAGLAISPGDALAPARGAVELTGASVKLGLKFSSKALDTAATLTDIAKVIGDFGFDQSIANYGTQTELLGELLDLQTTAKDEADQRVAVFKQVQVLTQVGDDYRTAVAKGIALMQERATFNKRVAAQTQQHRYQDISFRFSRNAALEKYRSSFDLASRYAYMAASAYDYDLNLGPDDSGSPMEIMADIVRQRCIGFVDGGGVPQIGGQGLAADLAKLKGNYDVLGARMGINNPILEESSFSLRTENFRILSETNSDADSAGPAAVPHPQAKLQHP